jgi:serine/threonine-protein kinase HipA
MNFNKGYFDRLGTVLKLNDKQMNAVYKRLVKWLPKAIQLIEMSFLTDDFKNSYKELITQRVNLLTR